MGGCCARSDDVSALSDLELSIIEKEHRLGLYNTSYEEFHNALNKYK